MVRPLNLDYEPGPQGESFSRVGPPPEHYNITHFERRPLPPRGYYQPPGVPLGYRRETPRGGGPATAGQRSTT